MKILNTPTKLDNNKGDWYYAVVDYETTSPGYGKDIKDTILSLQEIQELKINVEDCGGGDYFVIKTDRWAFDKIEDLIDLLNKFKTKHEKIK